jgi:class 3 adenylate cyclase/streptogramin lyase
VPKTRTTALRAVLFTDVVGSTELARELGDQRWTRLLEAQRRIVREQLRTNRGREVDTAGDGFFAVFEGPADAVRCAFAAARRVQDLGLDIRAGVHFGEIETSGSDAHGIVVHTGARVMSQAGAAEVLITQTVKDLVAGARFEVAERGVFDLKGVPGTWTLFDVVAVDDAVRPAPVATVGGAERRERATVPGAGRPSRRWIAVVAGIAVIAAALVGYFAFRPKPIYVPAAGTISRIDGDRFDRPVRVGAFPIALTEGMGRLWVMDRQSQVYWVSERDDSTGSRGTEGVPTGAVSGGGAVWITAGFGLGQGPDAAVSRLDPTTTQLTTAFRVPVDSQAIAFGAGAVWVADPNTAEVTRYDPLSGATRTIALPRARPDSIAFGDLGGQAVWVGDSLSPNAYRVDAATRRIRTYTVGSAPTAIAVGANAVWIVSERADAVYALDPTTGALRRTIDVGSEGCNAPRSIAVGVEAVWVACSGSQRVIGIDSEEAMVSASLAVAGAPAALATGQDGSVWVAVQPP